MARRRANGEGTLRKRADGRWESTLMVGWKEDGRPLRKSFYGKTQDEVKQKVQRWKATCPPQRIKQKEYRFVEWADMWFDVHKESISPTTAEGYRYILRHLKDYFGKRKLQEILPYDIEVFLKKKREKGLSDATLAQLKGMLFQIMAKAEGNLLIFKNPVQYVEKIRRFGAQKKRESFTAEEVQTLMEKLPYDRIGISVRLLLATGMRLQELLALEPRHIGEDGSTIWIEQAVCMVKGTVTIGPPKSRDSYRMIPVPPTLHTYVQKLRETKYKFIWEVGTPDMPCNPSHFRDQFRKALQDIPNVRILTPHCCRHTFVSQMHRLHVDLSTLQRMVGHADLDMTEHYLKVQEPVFKEAAARFGEAFPLARQ